MEYELIRSGRKSVAIIISDDGSVTVRAPFFVSKRRIEALLAEKEDWIRKAQEKQLRREKPPVLMFEEANALRRRAKELFPQLTNALSDRYQLPYGKLTVTSARTRFGSCSPKNNVSLSYFLAYYPIEAIEYVIAHELCHTVHHNHSDAFYRLLEDKMPDWRERKKLLNAAMPQLLKEG